MNREWNNSSESRWADLWVSLIISSWQEMLEPFELFCETNTKSANPNLHKMWPKYQNFPSFNACQFPVKLEQANSIRRALQKFHFIFKFFWYYNFFVELNDLRFSLVCTMQNGTKAIRMWRKTAGNHASPSFHRRNCVLWSPIFRAIIMQWRDLMPIPIP